MIAKGILFLEVLLAVGLMGLGGLIVLMALYRASESYAAAAIAGVTGLGLLVLGAWMLP